MLLFTTFYHLCRQAYFIADSVDEALSRGLDLVGALNEVSVHGVRAASVS